MDIVGEEELDNPLTQNQLNTFVFNLVFNYQQNFIQKP